MKSQQSQRKFSNVKLTREHHMPYMGLWVLVTGALTIVLNVVVFLFAEERWAGLTSLDNPFHEVYLSSRLTLIFAQILETVLFLVAIVFLAIVTSHRLAGPYVRLHNVFDEVRKGNLDVSLKFRSYDRLEKVEVAFNAMMAEIRERVRAAVNRGSQDSDR